MSTVERLILGLGKWCWKEDASNDQEGRNRSNTSDKILTFLRNTYPM
jgi:hypothetical protein